MVVGTNYHHFATDRCIGSYWWRLGNCTFYLLDFLVKQIYKNIVIMLAGLSLLAWYFDSINLFYLIGALAAFSIIPVCARGINWAWMKLAHILGWINSRIILSIVYILVLVPIAFLSRVFKKNSIPLSFDSRIESYYQERNHKFSAKDLENPW